MTARPILTVEITTFDDRVGLAVTAPNGHRLAHFPVLLPGRTTAHHLRDVQRATSEATAFVRTLIGDCGSRWCTMW